MLPEKYHSQNKAHGKWDYSLFVAANFWKAAIHCLITHKGARPITAMTKV